MEATEHRRLENNVVQIFRDVVAIKDFNPQSADLSVIEFWAKNHGWQEYDFRLMLEEQWKNPSSRRWLTAEPGRMNIRSFLNPKSADRLLGVIEDLRRAKVIANSVAVADKGPGSDLREQRILLSCCHGIYERRFMKVYYEFPTKDGPKFYWKWMNQDEYENHQCLKPEGSETNEGNRGQACYERAI